MSSGFPLPAGVTGLLFRPVALSFEQELWLSEARVIWSLSSSGLVQRNDMVHSRYLVWVGCYRGVATSCFLQFSDPQWCFPLKPVCMCIHVLVCVMQLCKWACKTVL
jgi:hypothetical protein